MWQTIGATMVVLWIGNGVCVLLVGTVRPTLAWLCLTILVVAESHPAWQTRIQPGGWWRLGSGLGGAQAMDADVGLPVEACTKLQSLCLKAVATEARKARRKDRW